MKPFTIYKGRQINPNEKCIFTTKSEKNCLYAMTTTISNSNSEYFITTIRATGLSLYAFKRNIVMVLSINQNNSKNVFDFYISYISNLYRLNQEQKLNFYNNLQNELLKCETIFSDSSNKQVVLFQFLHNFLMLSKKILATFIFAVKNYLSKFTRVYDKF